ncbi:MAG TPA: hypothetical protein VGB15_15270 [Longimicrobium sp.]|jgi:hypothetical protein
MSTLMQWNEDAYIRPMVDDGTKPDGDCQQTSVRFLAGSGVTNAGGYWQMDVADAVCEQIGLVRGVSFVATVTFNPSIDVIPDPSYVMTAHTASGGYVTLYARTWNCKCEPKPDTPFDYHVAIAYDFVGKTDG